MTITIKRRTLTGAANNPDYPISKTVWETPLDTAMATGKLLGRATAGAGEFEEITLADYLVLTGGTLALDFSGLPTANPGPGLLWNGSGFLRIGTNASLQATSYTEVNGSPGFSGGISGDGSGMRDGLDNSSGTCWGSNSTATSSLTAVLSSNMTLDHVVLRPTPATTGGWGAVYLNGAKLYYRPTGGGSWTFVTDITGAVDGSDLTFDLGGVTGAEVKVERTDSQYLGMSEFRVYAF